MKKMMENLKKILSNKKVRLETFNILRLTIPFVLMDIVIRVLTIDVAYFRKTMVLPSILFSVIWILLIVLTSMSLKQKAGRIVYATWFGLFFVVFLEKVCYDGV